MPPSLSNYVIKLLGVPLPVEANFYDPTTFLLLMLMTLKRLNHYSIDNSSSDLLTRGISMLSISRGIGHV